MKLFVSVPYRFLQSYSKTICCKQKQAFEQTYFFNSFKKMASAMTEEDFQNFIPKISQKDALKDYLKLMDDRMKSEVELSSETYNMCWTKISEAAMDCIWSMLFNENTEKDKDQMKEVGEFLKTLKEDACFYSPSGYNKWIVKVREELLKRNMLDFWKNYMVKNELGLCWARDSDLYDDMEDPEPVAFYKYAGCEAPWLNKSNKTSEAVTPVPLMTTDSPKAAPMSLKKISLESPLADYKHNMKAQDSIDPDDSEAYKEIFAEVREIVWKLLFTETNLTKENAAKACEVLEEYKRDACFFSPYDYNDWIPKVRDELLQRKYFDFWQDVIVKKELGVCCSKDSDYFDSEDQPNAGEFYKCGENLIKNIKK